MTDMSQSYQPQYGGQEDDAIVLSLGEGTTGGLASNLFAPPPEGTHRWQVVKVEKAFTRDGEIMVNTDCQIVETHTPGALGMTHTERLVIPGAVRFQHDKDSWDKMMRFLRLKLEGITGKPWRQDNIPLSPNRDLMGCVFIARCYHKESDPVVQTDGTSRTYTNSVLTDWTTPGIPQGAPQAAQGTLVGATPPPTLGQVMQPQQAAPAPTIQVQPQQPAQTLDEAAARMAAPTTDTQTVTQGDVATVPASILQPQQQPQQQAAPSFSLGQVAQPAPQAEQSTPSLGGMTFPIADQQQPENGGNAQPPQS